MFGISSKNSIIQPEISFDGALLKNYIEQCIPSLSTIKFTNTYSNQNRNRIGQTYEIVSTSTQTSWRPETSSTPNLTIQVSIESPFSDQWSVHLNHNTILLVKCLTLLNILFTTTPEGLEEASEALESMVEHYRESAIVSGQPSLPQEMMLIEGKILPSEVRPPLVINFE